jgi:DNA-binding response OmpR family regulator
MPHLPDLPVVPDAARASTHAGTAALAGSILVIDDDPDIQLVLQFALEEAGVTPVPALTGEQGLLIAAEARVDAALVDLRLPGLHGSELIPTLRAGSPMPILVITAQIEGAATTTVLGLGADDYLSKPFAPRDLIDRLTAQLDPNAPAPITAGRLSLDVPDGPIRLDGRPVELTRVERRLLAALMAAGQHALGPNELLRRVWGYRAPGDHAVVASMVARVQRRLAPSGDGLLMAGPTGYRLVVPSQSAHDRS